MKTALRAVLLLGLIAGFASFPVRGTQSLDEVVEPRIPPDRKFYVCLRAEIPLKIDGRLDDPAWRSAPWTEDFVDIEGSLRPAPRFRTRAKMLWDDNYFYVGAELVEPHLWATLTERDSIIFHDNDFEVFIDPEDDTFNYFELEINALNTVWDLFLVKPYRDGGPAVHAWDIAGLKTAVALDGTLNNPRDEDAGWTVEIAIPMDVLREAIKDKRPPAPGDRWRVNFSRVQWRHEIRDGGYEKVKDPKTGRPAPEDNWVWSPTGLVNIHYPERWGFVELSGAAAGSEAPAFDMTDFDDDVKLALREIYYKQRRHRAKSGMFSDDSVALGLNLPAIKGWDDPPVIQVTESLFEAVYRKSDGSRTWHIRQDGYVWKTETRKEETP